MSYKQNAASNRDALFGSGGGGAPKAKKTSTKARTTKASTTANLEDKAPSVSTSIGYRYDASKKKALVKKGLVGEEKAAKMKEAETYQRKAKKCMQKGMFSSADPLSASTLYKRAADDYQKCGEYRLERFNRMNSAECQLQVGAFATAAMEFTRAAELVAEDEGETLESRKQLAQVLHLKSADAWQNSNESAKAAACKVQAALALIIGDESRLLPGVALTALEEAVEAHVPDPLNPYSRYRQTGASLYVNADVGETAENPSPEAVELAKQQIVSRSYAHESVQEVVYLLVSYGEYASALYAAGAVTTLLSKTGVATLSLSRAFLAETILTLAMGDPIAAEENFLNRHVQESSYLTSRECKLAEELFRAAVVLIFFRSSSLIDVVEVKTRDAEALEEVRSRKGSNRAALGNLHECLRELTEMIRISGLARKGATKIETKPKKTKKKVEPKKIPHAQAKGHLSENNTVEPVSLDELESLKTGYEKDVGDVGAIDQGALQDELDALDFGDEESSLDDDSIDLR
eukprot:scaffold1378_cov137-Cylindrotheca_fusiformis.AAC.1